MSKHFFENIALLCVSLVAFLAEPTIVRAQDADYRPLGFLGPLKTSRGEVRPLSPDARYLDRAESCKFAEKEWGWADCGGVEFILLEPLEGLDTVVVQSPNSDGYVKFEDWQSGSETEIEQIWEGFVESCKLQSQRSGMHIQPVGWHMKPALIKQSAYLYYSTLINWNEDPTINAKAALFDRYGQVTFNLVPTDSNMTAVQLQALTEKFLSSYKPDPKTDYFSFQNGDKVAAGGAVGVLATLMGVKYGKAAATGILAIAIAFAKKLAFLVLALPVMLWRKIRGQKD